MIKQKWYITGKLLIILIADCKIGDDNGRLLHGPDHKGGEDSHGPHGDQHKIDNDGGRYLPGPDHKGGYVGRNPHGAENITDDEDDRPPPGPDDKGLNDDHGPMIMAP